MHASPWQQPFGQELVVQVHFCDEQAWLVPQLLHALPPPPHAELAVPGWHLPVASQHPFAQFDGLQVCGMSWQLPLVQDCVAVHCAHFAPPLPHAVWPVPVWQTPAVSQQPVQVEALHWTAWQLPLWHCSEVLHWAHCPPPLPQSAGLVPGMQTPL
jgi:hypothetical protein